MFSRVSIPVRGSSSSGRNRYEELGEKEREKKDKMWLAHNQAKRHLISGLHFYDYDVSERARVPVCQKV